MEISIKREKKKKSAVIPILLIAGVLLCLYFTFFNNKEEANIEDKDGDNVILTPEDIVVEEDVVIEGPIYEELFPVIEKQQAYVMAPKNINKKNPPTLILYSHGSNTTVTANMDDQFMKDLQQYGIFFTKHNYIFSASNQHGVNWGNTASIQDTINLKNWVGQNYTIQPKIFLIGFSMGGLPTLNFATTYPELIGKIALLAPTTKSADWNQSRADKLKEIDIKLWHGNKDVNVPYSYSVSFVKKMEGYGVNIEFITLEGKGHFDIDTQYMEEILQFFTN